MIEQKQSKTQKTKVISLYEETPKQFLNPTSGPEKVKNDPKIKSISKARIEGTTENKGCSTTWVDPKTEVETYCGLKNNSFWPPKVKNDPKIKLKSKVTIIINPNSTQPQLNPN